MQVVYIDASSPHWTCTTVLDSLWMAHSLFSTKRRQSLNPVVDPAWGPPTPLTTSNVALELKPNAQRKTELNWTGSFSSVQLSSVQFSGVHWTGDELRRPSQLVAGFRPTTDIALIGRFTRMCPRLRRTCDDRQFRLRIVAGSMHSGKLNWTEQFSWVELSSVSRCAVHWA